MKMLCSMPFLCLCCLLLLFVSFTSNAVAATISYKFVSYPKEEPINIDADTKQRIIEGFNLPQEWSKPREKIKIGDILKDESFQIGEILWKFYRASPDNRIINSDTVITLYWTPKQESKKCKVSFQYAFDSGWREFPEIVHDSIKNQFPIQQEMEILQYDVLDLANINDSCFGNGRFVDQENDGVWTTEGYKNKLGTDRVIIKDDVTFTAVWTFKGNEYDVRYLAVSADETKPFPETLTESAQPAKKQKVEKGDWVRAYAPAELQIEDGTGKWVFTGYTRSVILGQSGDNCFIGKWKYLEKTPQVTYTFISDTIGADLPQDILQYLPLDTKEYSEGEIVKAIEPTEKRFQSKHDKDYSSVNNCWKFVGYDADEKTMADGGVSFTGKWVRITEASTRMLIYTSTDEDEAIPDELYQAAKVDGTSDLKYLVKVMIPICQPTVVTIIILKVIECWNSYVWPRLITYDANYYLVSNGIQEIRENGFGRENTPAMMAAVVVISVPLIILFLVFRKKIMAGVSRGGTKG